MVDPLQVRALSVELQGKIIVHDVDWSAKKGQINAILGPNGAGKSTLLRAVAGLTPHRGEVQLDGRPLARFSRLERATRMAWVPQHSQLNLPLTVVELVSQGRFAHMGPSGRPRDADREKIEEALQDVHCAHLAHRSWSTLSGGERRRVMIARSLATEAKILLLDEPIASLDIEHALRVMGLLRDLASRGYTLVPVLHDLDLAHRFADNVALLNGGRIDSYGLATEVIRPDTVERVYGVTMRPEGALRFDLRGDA